MKYSEMCAADRKAQMSAVTEQYNAYKAKGLSLDLSRGKPSAEQLALSMPMLNEPMAKEDCIASNGFDCRNYGLPDGVPEMRRLFAEMTGIPAENILIGGNSSLNLMYNTIVYSLLYGTVDSPRPWIREEKVKFLCPVPGYDRHFGICESLGIEMISVPMNADGPDMDTVEALVASDPAIKGMWNVPKYSNPTGITYSDAVVDRLAKMKTAAPDFRLFWDNAYIVHDLGEKGDELLDIFETTKKYGNENRVYYFTSSSKVTFPGAGVAIFAASDKNLAQIRPIINVQTIGHDKLNQLRHVKFLSDKNAVHAQMMRHAEILRRKFSIVLDTLESELGGLGIASWTRPVGGYFVSFDAQGGCATRIYELCKNAGVTLTSVGATFPYGKDPDDKNLRLAPTFPSDSDLALAMQVFTTAVKLATLEKMI